VFFLQSGTPELFCPVCVSSVLGDASLASPLYYTIISSSLNEMIRSSPSLFEKKNLLLPTIIIDISTCAGI